MPIKSRTQILKEDMSDFFTFTLDRLCFEVKVLALSCS
jgi:hypothetical protein